LDWVDFGLFYFFYFLISSIIIRFVGNWYSLFFLPFLYIELSWYHISVIDSTSPSSLTRIFHFHSFFFIYNFSFQY
jgi:hypothetical protein